MEKEAVRVTTSLQMKGNIDKGNSVILAPVTYEIQYTITLKENQCIIGDGGAALVKMLS